MSNAFFDFISAIPWYVYLGIAAIILVIVYLKADYQIQAKMKRIFSPIVITFIIFICLWIWWFSAGFIVPVNVSMIVMPNIAWFLILFLFIMETMRYHSKQVITPNFHGSFTKATLVDGFYLFNIGAIEYLFPDANKILVVREETAEIMENSAISLSRVSSINLIELPPDVEDFIKNSNYLKGASNNIFYGWFDDLNRIDYMESEEGQELLSEYRKLKKDDELYKLIKEELNVDNPKVGVLLQVLKNVNAHLNKLRNMFGDIINDTEEGSEHYKRMRRTFSDKQDINIQRPEGYEG